MKKYVSLVLTIAMCLSVMAMPVSAEEGEEIASATSSIDAEIEETAVIQLTDGDLMQDAYADEQDDEFFPVGSSTDIKEGTESLGGTVELTPDGNEVDIGGDDETLGFGEEAEAIENIEELAEFQNTQVEFDESSDFDLGDSEGTLDEDSSEDLALFGASVSASRNEIVLNKGNSITINISYSNAPKNGKLKVGAWKNVLFTSDAVSFSWGTASGGKAPLTISGKKSGTCYVEVFLCNSAGIPYAIAQIKVNVCEAALSCTSDLNNFKVTKGGAKTVYFRASGYTGESELSYTTTNNSAYTCTLSSGTLTITGKSAGSGTVRVYYKAKATGDTLSSIAFTVTTVEPSIPKLKVSSSGLSLTAGSSQNITVTYSGYEGSVSMRYGYNSNAVKCAWSGGWSGNSRVLQISGNQNGSATITVYLLSATNEQLATANIQATVAPKPEISPSSYSLSLVSGNSGTVAFSLKNVTSKNSLVCTNLYSNICSVALSPKDGKYVLTVAAKNAGSATLTVSIRDAYGNDITSAKVLVSVKSAPPKLVASKTNVSLTSGKSQVVIFTYSNCSENVQLSFSRSGGDISTATWGSWSGNSIPLTIKGDDIGTCSYTVRLIRASDSVALAEAKVSVSVTASVSNKIDIKELSYSFQNYSKYYIDRKICTTMYGDNQVAENIYRYNLGNGGVCFGMSTSSGLLYAGNVSKQSFNRSKTSVSQLSKGDYNSSLSFTLTDFIEAMHITQAATTMYRNSGIDTTAHGIMSEIDAGRIAFVCVRGQTAGGDNGGHAITAFDYSLSGNTLTVNIYDSNSPLKTKYLTFTRPSTNSAFNTWSFDMGGHGIWGSGKKYADIEYITYNTLLSVWQKRGSLYSVWNSQGKWYNLVCTTESNFALYTVDYETTQTTTVAKIEENELTESISDVYHIQLSDIDNIEGDSINILFVPRDYYFVQDDTPNDGITISIVDEFLSTTIQTNVSDSSLGAMSFCAEDTEQIAEAVISVLDGAEFHISIGSTTSEGVSKNIVKEGIGSGRAVNLGLTAGKLSLGAAEDSENTVVTEEFTSATYDITAYAGKGGNITPEGMTTCKEGENLLYKISSEDGYIIDRVYVDGEDVGAVASWYFEDISDYHTITATFKRDISKCSVQLTQSSFKFDGTEKAPEVVVTADNGDILEENIDYLVCYNDNVEPGLATAVVLALADGAYYGVSEVSFEITGSADTMIQNANVSGTTINVVLDESAYDVPSLLIGALYDKSGKLLSARCATLSTYGEVIQLNIDIDVPKHSYLKLFLLSSNSYAPRTAPYYLPMDR